MALRLNDTSGDFVSHAIVIFDKFQTVNSPLGVEGVLRRHAPAHDSVQERLSLPRVETEHLGDTNEQGSSQNCNIVTYQQEHRRDLGSKQFTLMTRSRVFSCVFLGECPRPPLQLTS